MGAHNSFVYGLLDFLFGDDDTVVVAENRLRDTLLRSILKHVVRADARQRKAPGTFTSGYLNWLFF